MSLYPILLVILFHSGRVLSEVFMQVPPQAQYPDYYQLIARPISFQLVRVSLAFFPYAQKHVLLSSCIVHLFVFPPFFLYTRACMD